jgi:hypothetical protein
VLLGRVELLRYLREQAVSRTLHRYGNVVRPFDEAGAADPEPPAFASSEGDAELDHADGGGFAALGREARGFVRRR